MILGGVKHGDTVYIGNTDVVMTSVIEQKKIDAAKAEAARLAAEEEAKKKAELAKNPQQNDLKNS